MSDFAKLFSFDDLGQVLVMLDSGDNGAEVRIYFMPPGLGVCAVNYSFHEGVDGSEWDKADRAFAMVDRERAEAIVRETLKTIPAGLGDES